MIAINGMGPITATVWSRTSQVGGRCERPAPPRKAERQYEAPGACASFGSPTKTSARTSIPFWRGFAPSCVCPSSETPGPLTPAPLPLRARWERGTRPRICVLTLNPPSFRKRNARNPGAFGQQLFLGLRIAGDRVRRAKLLVVEIFSARPRQRISLTASQAWVRCALLIRRARRVRPSWSGPSRARAHSTGRCATAARPRRR